MTLPGNSVLEEAPWATVSGLLLRLASSTAQCLWVPLSLLTLLSVVSLKPALQRILISAFASAPLGRVPSPVPAPACTSAKWER